MKIAIATYDFLPNIGGVSTTVAILAKEFANRDHNVTVLTLAPGKDDGGPYHVIRHPSVTQLVHHYLTADILILTNLSLRLAWPLLWINRKFALQHHSESAFKLGKSIPDVLRKRITLKAKHFMTSDFVGRRSGLQGYAVTHPFPDPLHEAQSSVSPIVGRKNAVFVGRLEPEKGIIWLAERWNRVRGILGVDVLRVVGSGSLSEVVAEKIASGEWPHVKFIGPLQLSETAREMGAAAYMFVPSLWEEPFGAVALEGIAAGAITVVSDRGGLREAGADLAVYYNPEDDATFMRALEEARVMLERHTRSAQARGDYLEAVKAHLMRFSPAAVVATIVKEMT